MLRVHWSGLTHACVPMQLVHNAHVAKVCVDHEPMGCRGLHQRHLPIQPVAEARRCPRLRCLWKGGRNIPEKLWARRCNVCQHLTRQGWGLGLAGAEASRRPSCVDGRVTCRSLLGYSLQPWGRLCDARFKPTPSDTKWTHARLHLRHPHPDPCASCILRASAGTPLWQTSTGCARWRSRSPRSASGRRPLSLSGRSRSWCGTTAHASASKAPSSTRARSPRGRRGR